MKYGEYLAECRRRAGEREKPPRLLSKAEFARKIVNDEGKPYTEEYYAQCERGDVKGGPGKYMLEQAALLAGLASFEECIRFPSDDPAKRRVQEAVEVFTIAAQRDDFRHQFCMDTVVTLLTMKKPKRAKSGGRPPRKQPGSGGESRT